MVELNEEKVKKHGVTPGELERIKEQRKFDLVERDTLTWKIALHLEHVRLQVKEIKNTITKRLWVITDHQDDIDYMEVQVKSGKIVETGKDGEVLTPAKVISSIEQLKWMKNAEPEVIVKNLSELRAYADNKDYSGKTIISIEEFDEYAIGILDKLKKLGYDVLKEE